jgi:hypothetical protein
LRQRDRFELLIINVLNMLGLHYDGMKRGLAPNKQPSGAVQQGVEPDVK